MTYFDPSDFTPIDRVADAIFKQRKAKKITQTQLASKMNVSPSLVRKWENAEVQSFKSETLYVLSQILDIDLYSIYASEPPDDSCESNTTTNTENNSNTNIDVDTYKYQGKHLIINTNVISKEDEERILGIIARALAKK